MTAGAGLAGDHGTGAGPAPDAREEDSPVRPPGARHRSDIQGLRAVAVLVVMAYHAGLPIPGGFTGVDMFFVISGFVITGALQPRTGSAVGSTLGSFYGRRIRRLLPALALTIVVVAAASTLLLSPLGPQQSTSQTGIAAALFSANLYLRSTPSGYFDLAASTNPLLHTWSLSVEEQFYLVFPVLLIGGSRLARRLTPRSTRATLTALVAAMMVASFALSYSQSNGPPAGPDAKYAFFSAAARAWEFGLGALVAILEPWLASRIRRGAIAASLVGAALVAAGLFGINGLTSFPGTAVLLPALGTTLIIVAGTASNRGLSAALSTRPMTWVGDRSYGLYLWHWPLIVFAAALWPLSSTVLVLAAAVSFAPTVLSYRLVENPIRFGERFAGRRVIPLAAACMTLPILACLVLGRVSEAEQQSTAVTDYEAQTTFTGTGWVNCNRPIAERAPQDCRRVADHARGEAYLVGDSNAAHFLEPVAAGANRSGYDATMAVMTGCPFVDLVHADAVSDGQRCHQFVTETVDHLVANPPSVVVIGVSSPEVVDDRSPLTDPHTGETATDPEAKTVLWERGVRSVFDRLTRADIPVVFVHTIPHLAPHAVWSADTCPMVRILGGTCDVQADRQGIDTLQHTTRDAEARAAAGNANVALLDVANDVCSLATCSSVRDGRWVYRDATHLTLAGSTMLTDRFAEVIGQHARPNTNLRP